MCPPLENPPRGAEMCPPLENPPPWAAPCCARSGRANPEARIATAARRFMASYSTPIVFRLGRNGTQRRDSSSGLTPGRSASDRWRIETGMRRGRVNGFQLHAQVIRAPIPDALLDLLPAQVLGDCLLRQRYHFLV